MLISILRSLISIVIASSIIYLSIYFDNRIKALDESYKNNYMDSMQRDINLIKEIGGLQVELINLEHEVSLLNK